MIREILRWLVGIVFIGGAVVAWFMSMLGGAYAEGSPDLSRAMYRDGWLFLIAGVVIGIGIIVVPHVIPRGWW